MATTPTQICLVLEALSGHSEVLDPLQGPLSLSLRVPPLEYWNTLLDFPLPLVEPRGAFVVLLDVKEAVEVVEVRLEAKGGRSYAAAVRLNGQSRIRGRILLFDVADPSSTLQATIAVALRVLPLTPREMEESGTQTVRMSSRSVASQVLLQAAVSSVSVQIGCLPLEEVACQAGTSSTPIAKEERENEVMRLVEEAVAKRMPKEGRKMEKPLSRLEMLRRGVEERMRLKKEAAELTPPPSPRKEEKGPVKEEKEEEEEEREESRATPSSSSSSSSSSTSGISRSSSQSESSSTTGSSSSSSSSIEPPARRLPSPPPLSPTSKYLKELRERILAERVRKS